MQVTHLLLLAAALGCCALPSQADFGQAIVDEGIDLSELQNDDGDPRSMEDLLHWAISNSDPDKLSSQAQEAQRVQMVRDLKEQRSRVKELLDHVRSQPTETDMMKEGIAILRRPGASHTELLAALQALQVMVEPMDNANDLHPLGGISLVVAQLTRGSVELSTAAAHVIGTAASNNPTFQRHLLTAHPEVLETLLQVSAAPQQDCSMKGLYAVAAMVRNLHEARVAFMDAGGFRSLELLLRGESVSPRVKRRALSLFMDLVDTEPAAGAAAAAGAGGGGVEAAEGQPEGGSDSGAAAEAEVVRTIQLGADEGDGTSAGMATSGSGSSSASSVGALATAAIGTGLPEAVVALLLQPDPDMQEKALLVVQRLAADAVARQVLQANGAGEALHQLQQRLLEDAPSPADEPDPYHDYLTDLTQRVAGLMAQHAPQQQREGGERQQGEEGQGQAGGQAAAEKERGRGKRSQEQKGEEGQQPVLALGGPSRPSRIGSVSGSVSGSGGDAVKGRTTEGGEGQCGGAGGDGASRQCASDAT